MPIIDTTIIWEKCYFYLPQYTNSKPGNVGNLMGVFYLIPVLFFNLLSLGTVKNQSFLKPGFLYKSPLKVKFIFFCKCVCLFWQGFLGWENQMYNHIGLIAT